MPEAYKLHEARFIQDSIATSAADAIFVLSGAVPAGKVWTILGANYFPSAAETRTIQIGILRPTNYFYPVQVPVSIALSLTLFFPCATEGLEINLFPGEMLKIVRDVATAGSTMTILLRYIETDLPYYSYEEPLNKVVKTKVAHGSVFRRTGGITIGSGGGTSGGGESGSGGKLGGPLPI